MARHTRSGKEHSHSARENVNRLLDSPLRAIAEKVGRDLEEAECAFNDGTLPLDKLVKLCSYVSELSDRLPQTFGQRFFFDTAMVRAIASDWDGSLTLSDMVIPCYGREWGHARLQMPSEDQEHVHLIDLIVLPGEDRLDDVDLLSYPLIAHELGHYLLLRDDSSFRNAFASSLTKRVRSLRLASVADQGAARTKAQAVVRELQKLWTPSADHKNWAHELAIDLMALWTCGPAYLACFQDELEEADINPFQVSQDHPPYALRVDALVKCGRELGFEDDCSALEGVGANWDRLPREEGERNLFLVLADRELIADCTRAALASCRALKIRQCTPSTVQAARRSLEGDPEESLGVNLLLHARLVLRQKGRPAFDTWERAKVERIAGALGSYPADSV